MDSIWISQVVIAVLMGLLAIVIFKRYPLKISTKMMVQVAFLMLISILLGSTFKIELPLLGPNSFEIKFDTLPIMFIGMLFGPGWGFISGFMIDVLQLLISPPAFPYLGFTFNLVLTGVIAGLIFYQRESKNLSLYTKVTQALVFILALVAIGLVVFVDEFRIGGQMVQIQVVTKILVSLALLVAGGLLIAMINKTSDSAFSSKYMRIVVLCEILIQMVLTSLWLTILFKIPFWLSLAPRIVEGIFMVLVLHFVGLILARSVFRQQFFKK